MKESDILNICRLEASRLGATVWRNNVGTYKTGNRFIRFGLCVGSSDLIGIYKGRFLAIETKMDGKNPTLEQANFLKFVQNQGGIAGVCRNKKDVENLLTQNLIRG